MKYAIGIGAVILGGLIAWYVFTTNHQTPDTSTETADGVSTSKKAPSTSEPSTATSATTTENKDSSGLPPVKVEGKKRTEGVAGEPGSDEENSEEDYGEPVSKEDFKDFITTALDELAEDETTAIAIVKEMDKISRAQPNHEDEVLRFYRECAKRPKVSPKVQEACNQALRDKGF